MRWLKFLLVALQLLLFAHSSFAYRPEVPDIFLTEDGVAVGSYVSENERYVVFSPEGKFLKDLIFKVDDHQIQQGFLGLTNQNEFVFIKDNSYHEEPSTSLYVFSKEHKLVALQELSGNWTARMDGGNVFVSNPEESKFSGLKELIISKIDLQSGERSKLIGINNDSREIEDWVIDSQNNVYIIVGEKDNTYFEKHSNTGKRVFREPLFNREIEEADLVLSHVDTSGRVYLIQNPQQEDAVVRVYTSSGALERSMELPGLESMVTKKDEIFAIQNYSVVRISAQSKVLNTWTFIPPLYGETWEEKWKREKKASEVSAASSTDDLLMVAIYSLDETSHISEWLKERGAKILPSLIEKILQYPSSPLDYLVVEFQEVFPDQVTPLLQNAFENGNYEQKKNLLQILFQTKQDNSQSVIDFLNEMKTHGADDKEIADDLLDSLGIDTGKYDSLIEQLRNQSLTKDERERLYWEFYGNNDVVFKKLLPILLDSKDPLRSEARTLLLKVLRNEGYEEEQISDEIKAQVRKWTSDPDRFIADFAAVVMLGLGSSEFLDTAFQAAKTDRILAANFIDHFSTLSNKTPDIANKYIAEVLDLAINIASTEIGKPYQEMNYEIAYLPTTLIQAGSPQIKIATLGAISNPGYSTKIRASLTNALSPFLKDFTAKEIQKILTLPDSFGLNDSSYYRFMKEVGQSFSHNKEIRRMLRDRIFSDLSVADSNSYGSLLHALEGLVEKEDLNILLPFLEMEKVSCGGSVVHQTLNLLDEIAPLPELEDRLVVFFSQSDYAVESTKILSQHGYPPAFEVLMLAIQSDEDHSLEGRHFKAYSEFAEHALISLLNSPNTTVQSRCAEILDELNSTTAYPIIRKQFDDSVQDQKLPVSGIVAGLMLYGDKPFQEIMNIGKKYDFLKFKKEGWNYFPARLAKNVIEQLEEIILKETDPDRAQFGAWLLEYSVDHNQAQSAFNRLAQKHPVEKIRELFSGQRTTYRRILSH